MWSDFSFFDGGEPRIYGANLTCRHCAGHLFNTVNQFVHSGSLTPHLTHEEAEASRNEVSCPEVTEPVNSVVGVHTEQAQLPQRLLWLLCRCWAWWR